MITKGKKNKTGMLFPPGTAGNHVCLEGIGENGKEGTFTLFPHLNERIQNIQRNQPKKIKIVLLNTVTFGLFTSKDSTTL